MVANAEALLQVGEEFSRMRSCTERCNVRYRPGMRRVARECNECGTCQLGFARPPWLRRYPRSCLGMHWRTGNANTIALQRRTPRLILQNMNQWPKRIRGGQHMERRHAPCHRLLPRRASDEMIHWPRRGSSEP